MQDLVTTNPNATKSEIVSPQYVALVGQYRLYTKQTAEAIIRAAETLYTAQETLPPMHFHQFCKEVELVEEGAKFKKLMMIGKTVSRFEPYLDRLPNAWTTIYKLATLEEGKFEQVVQSTLFAPFMTANDVALILDGPKAIKGGKKADGLTIDLSGLAKPVQRDVYRQLRELKQRFGFNVTANGEFKAIASAVETDAILDKFLEEQSEQVPAA